jgi:hypothetical protein
MAQWHNGAMAQWHNGAMAQWHNGAMAQRLISIPFESKYKLSEFYYF